MRRSLDDGARAGIAAVKFALCLGLADAAPREVAPYRDLFQRAVAVWPQIPPAHAYAMGGMPAHHAVRTAPMLADTMAPG